MALRKAKERMTEEERAGQIGAAVIEMCEILTNHGVTAEDGQRALEEVKAEVFARQYPELPELADAENETAIS